MNFKNNVVWGRIFGFRVNQMNIAFADVSTFKNSVYENVPVLQEYGITSHPKIGGRCVLIALNGDSENMICIATGPSSGNLGEINEQEVLLSSGKDTGIHLKETVEIKGNTNIEGNMHAANYDALVEIIKDINTAINKLNVAATVNSGATSAYKVEIAAIQTKLDALQ